MSFDIDKNELRDFVDSTINSYRFYKRPHYEEKITKIVFCQGLYQNMETHRGLDGIVDKLRITVTFESGVTDIIWISPEMTGSIAGNTNNDYFKQNTRDVILFKEKN